MLSDECRERLLNFKFQQAAYGLDDEATIEERYLIYSLAGMLEDSGWVGGNLGMIVLAALKSIGVVQDPGDD